MDIIKMVKKHWAGVLIITLSSATVAAGLSLMQTPKYQTTSRILILQRNDSGIDAYTLARASEKMGNNLATLIETSSFLGKVVQTGLVASTDFAADEVQRREEWQKMVSAQLTPETSILEVSAIHPDREKAGRIVVAIESILFSQSAEFLGLPKEQVFMQLVDAPLTSTHPIEPRLLLNILMGGCAGLFLSMGYVMAREAGRGVGESRRERLTANASLESPAMATAYQGNKKEHYFEMDEKATGGPINAPVRVPVAQEVLFRRADDANRIPIRNGSQEDSEEGKMHTMYDDVNAPFGNQYYFENRIIQLDERI